MNTVDLNMLERYLTGRRKRTTEEIAQHFGVDKRTVRACVSKLDNEERLVLWSSDPDDPGRRMAGGIEDMGEVARVEHELLGRISDLMRRLEAVWSWRERNNLRPQSKAFQRVFGYRIKDGKMIFNFRTEKGRKAAELWEKLQNC